MDLRTTPGFLGPSLLSDITLVIYIFLLVPLMFIGYVYARRKQFFPQHRAVMTTLVIVNWVLISWVMVASYRVGVAPNLSTDFGSTAIWLPTLHLVIGALSQVLATYLALRMWLERVLPSWLMVKNIKFWMRLALSGWLITVLLGIALYAVWYGPAIVAARSPEALEEPVATEAVVDPASTEEAEAEADAEDEAEVEEPAATEEAEADAEDEAEVGEPAATEEAEADAEGEAEVEEPAATEEAG